MKILYWTIALLATAAICTGAIYYLRQPAPDLGPVAVHRMAKSSPSAATAPPATATSSPADVSGWKTYSNAQYGFSFEYPNSWVMDSSNLIIGQTIDITPEGTNNSQNGFGDFANGVSFSVNVNTNGISLADWIAQNSRTDGTDSQVTIGGAKAIKKIFVDDVSGNPAQNVYISVGQNILMFTANDNNIQTLDKLLSTFKFINPQSSAAVSTSGDTSNWKTYTNSQYGFSFQYPTFGNKVEEITDTDAIPGIIFFEFGYVENNYFNEGFKFDVGENTNGLTIQDWFSKNVDGSGALIKAGNFEIENIPGGGQAYELTNLPLYEGYQGGPVELAYIMSPDKKYIFSFNLSQDGTSDFQNHTSQLLSTFKFTN